MTTGLVLAVPGGVDQQDWVGPGLLGLVVILALLAATILLWRNMNKQLRKVRDRYAAPPEANGSQPPARVGPAGTDPDRSAGHPTS